MGLGGIERKKKSNHTVCGPNLSKKLQNDVTWETLKHLFVMQVIVNDTSYFNCDDKKTPRWE